MDAMLQESLLKQILAEFKEHQALLSLAKDVKEIRKLLEHVVRTKEIDNQMINTTYKLKGITE